MLEVGKILKLSTFPANCLKYFVLKQMTSIKTDFSAGPGVDNMLTEYCSAQCPTLVGVHRNVGGQALSSADDRVGIGQTR